MGSSNDERDPIERLADSFLARFRRGERPSIDEYAAKHPDLADEIRELLPALVALEQDMSVDAQAVADSRSNATESRAAVSRQLGEYMIIREIGRGGMGVVYEAEQETLGRHVALKVLPGAGLGGTHLKRFRLEARAAARLHHSNIVPVFGVGEAEGVHYYAMQFIKGQGLDAVIDELARQKQANRPQAVPSAPCETGIRPSAAALAQSLATGQLPSGGTHDHAATGASGLAHVTGRRVVDSPTVTHAGPAVPPADSTTTRSSRTTAGVSSELSTSHSAGHFYRAVAKLGVQVAEALAYAHGQGILHRDIKPSNLLLDADGTVWVTDFGLAKSEGTDALTQTGDIVGTLRYMAPEQFDGWSDPRSDVYALGATLYELLALAPVYSEANRAKLMERVLHDSPVPLRKLDRGIPRDLETIVLKALAKEPAQRYTTAEALAEDLRRFSADKTILARRSSPAEKAMRWCRRNPLAAGLLAMLVVVFLTAFVAVTLAWRSALASGTLAERRRGDAERNEREADRQRQRAQAGFAKARSAVDEYLNKVTDSQPLTAPGLRSLRRDLLESGLNFYQDFLKEHAGDAGLRLAEADVQLRAAKIMSEINPGAPARAALEKAGTLFEALHRDQPNDPDVQAGFAQFLISNERPFRAAALLEPLTERYAGKAVFQRRLLDALNSAATARSDRDDPEETLKLRLRCYEVAKALVKAEPQLAENHRRVAFALNNIAIMLDRDPVTRGEDELDLLGHAVAYGQRCLELDPNDTISERFVSLGRCNIAISQVGNGFVDAGLKGFEEAVELGRKLVGKNPQVLRFQRDLLSELHRKAWWELDVGRKEQAARTLAEIVERASLLEAEQPQGGEAARARAAGLARLAEIGGQGASQTPVKSKNSAAMADLALAALERAIHQGYRDLRFLKADRELNVLRGRADYQAMVARLENTLRTEAHSPPKNAAKEPEKSTTSTSGSNPSLEAKSQSGRMVDDRVELGDVSYAAGVLFAYQERYDDSRKRLDQALALREAVAREHPLDPWHRLRVVKVHASLAELLQRQARFTEADRELALCRQQTERLLQDHSQNKELAGFVGIMLWQLGYRCAMTGLWEDARGYFIRASEIGIPQAWTLRDYNRGMLELYLGDRESAKMTCRSAVAIYRDFDDTFHAAELAKLCAVAGDSGVDTAEILRMGEQGARTEGDGYYGWMTFYHGLEYYRAGRYDEVLRMLDRIADDVVLTTLGINIRAMTEHKLGHFEQAKARLAEAREIQRNLVQNALARSPADSPWSWYTWFEFRLLHQEAETLIEGRPAREPWRPLFLARVEAARGHTARAESLLAEVVRQAPDDSEVLAARARVWSEIHRDALALSDVDRAITVDPRNFHALCERGRIALKQDRIDAAVGDLLKALEQCSTEKLASYEERARADNVLAASEPAYRKAIAARPTDAPLRLARARYLAWHRRWADADREIEFAKLPAKLEQWGHRTVLRLAADDLAGYYELCRKMLAAVGDKPTDDDMRSAVVRGLTLASNDIMDAAKLAAWGYETTQAHPRLPWHRHAWAFALYRAGKYDLAAEQFVESLKVDRFWSGRPANWLGLAMCDARRDRLEEGRVSLAKAERWIEESGRDPAAQARAFPAKVHEFEWIAANVLVREARKELETAEENRRASTLLSGRSPPK